MNKKKIVGYIVKGPIGLKAIGDNNVLWFNSPASLFATYNDARQAIRRTLTYAKKNGYNNDCWTDLTIVAVMEV